MNTFKSKTIFIYIYEYFSYILKIAFKLHPFVEGTHSLMKDVNEMSVQQYIVIITIESVENVVW